MLFAWVFSPSKRTINWKVVLWGVGLQIIFGFFIFIVPIGTDFFLFLNNVVIKVIESATTGTRFLFGRLALPPGTKNEFGEESLGFILAFQALPTIVFFASLMGILYYLGIMPRLISLFARLFSRLMRISGAEALCASSNIFVGVESAATIRPYIARMTPSELCTVLTAGMSTIASSVLALYVFILNKQFPSIAGHLISASVLSAPAAIVMSKLIMPETDTPETLGIKLAPHYERESSITESAINGANAGLRLVAGIVALLLAFLSLASLVDMFLGGVVYWLNPNINLSLERIFGYIFYPFTIIIGVPIGDAPEVARIIGMRVIGTEVKSYQELSLLMSNEVLRDPRSALLCVYALCGFAHIASLAIFVGGTSALAPERAKDIARLGPRALLAATLACLMTACIAGLFYKEGSVSILFGTIR